MLQQRRGHWWLELEATPPRYWKVTCRRAMKFKIVLKSESSESWLIRWGRYGEFEFFERQCHCRHHHYQRYPDCKHAVRDYCCVQSIMNLVTSFLSIIVLGQGFFIAHLLDENTELKLVMKTTADLNRTKAACKQEPVCTLLNHFIQVLVSNVFFVFLNHQTVLITSRCDAYKKAVVNGTSLVHKSARRRHSWHWSRFTCSYHGSIIH